MENVFFMWTQELIEWSSKETNKSQLSCH